MEITEGIKREITKAFSARSCLVEILRYFEKNETLSKDKLFELLKEGNSKTSRFFEEDSGNITKTN